MNVPPAPAGNGGIRRRRDGDPDPRILGMKLFLVSLSVLFAAAVVAHTVVRVRVGGWRPAAAPPLPPGLWLSTALVAGGSLTVQRAVSAIRRGDQRGLRRRLGATVLLAVGFLAMQVWNGTVFFSAATIGSDLYGFGFYLLIGLHALHVVGGLAALGVVVWRARGEAYTWAHHSPVRLMALYWHYLGVVWLVLLAVLLSG